MQDLSDMDWSLPRPTKVPGFGLHLRHMPQDEFVHGRRVRFPNAITDFHARLLTAHEIQMMGLMNYITDKVKWSERIHDPDTVERWRIQTLHSPWNPEAWGVSEQGFDYCIQELRDKSQKLGQSGMTQVFDTPDATVVKSETAVTTQIRNDLKKELRKLETDTKPDEDQDIIRILINPCLYALQPDRSRILSTMRLSCKVAGSHFFLGRPWMPDKGFIEYGLYRDGSNRVSMRGDIGNPLWSNGHQCLPTDVTWRPNGSPRLRGYVNNIVPDKLHPDTVDPKEEDRKVYPLIEKVIAASVPLWNTVLSSLGSNHPSRLSPRSYRTSCPSPPPDLQPHTDAHRTWRDNNNLVVGPEPTAYEGASFGTGNPVNLVDDFADGIQVIVRVTTVELTPANPELKCDNWYIEGMMNEHICAVAVFIYDEQNTSGGAISFRQRSDPGEFLALCKDNGQLQTCAKVFGIPIGDDAYQYFGCILETEGRLIVYPNVLQTSVNPVTLKDQSRAGHLKFLTLLLVDPHLRVLSTANFLPRQRDWWAMALWAGDDHKLCHQRLPREVFDMVVNFAYEDDGFTSPEQARAERATRYGELIRFSENLTNRVHVFNIPDGV